MSEYSTTDDFNLLQEALRELRGGDQQRIAETGLSIVATLLRKNADYGGSAHKSPVLLPDLGCGTSILVRMSDKIERLRNLLNSDSDAQVQESIDDTMMDLAGYAILYLCRP